MKRNLFIVNTYFQLITAINLSLNNLKNNTNDIILTDLSVDMDVKIDKIRNTGIFNKVYFLNCKKILNQNKLKKLLYYFQNNPFSQNYTDKYDELIFYNFDLITFSVIDQLIKKNKDLKCSKFDEGFDTYTVAPCNINIIKKIIRLISCKKNLDNVISKLYIYYPELLCYETDLVIEQIPNLDKDNHILRNNLNLIFDYKKMNIKQKYVFFEESFLCDNKGVEDLDLIKNIVDIVNKDNIIIKLHPRNGVNRFKELGVDTIQNIGIPWEIMQMNEDFSDKIFLTISSGSVLASKLYFHENIKTYLLYNCTQKLSPAVTDNYKKYIDKLNEKSNSNKIIIPRNQKDFLKDLKEDIN